MGMIKEFREFAMKGSVIDLAVGIIIGAAFGKIVSSLVDDILMPPLGMLLGKVDFSALKLIMQQASVVDGKPVAEVALNYGRFINNAINFLLVAFAVFLLIKAINEAKKRAARNPPPAPPAPPAPPSKQELLLTEIRDLLKAR